MLASTTSSAKGLDGQDQIQLRLNGRQRRRSAAAALRTKFGDIPQSLTKGEKKIVQTLLSALEPLSALRGSIPLPYVTTFLLIALEEGKGVNTYAREVGMHRSAMSRYLRDIGARARNGGKGLGLVTVREHPTDPVRSQVFLTAKGRSIARQVFQQFRKAESGEQSALGKPADR